MAALDRVGVRGALEVWACCLAAVKSARLGAQKLTVMRGRLTAMFTFADCQGASSCWKCVVSSRRGSGGGLFHCGMSRAGVAPSCSIAQLRRHGELWRWEMDAVGEGFASPYVLP